MARTIALISALLLMFAVTALAHGHGHGHGHGHPPPSVFHVEGHVYCDPCRVQFETVISKRIQGATVRLECRDMLTKSLTYSVEGVTGTNGDYSLQVLGEHETDVCEVSIVRSPMPDCYVPMDKLARSKIECTQNMGMSSPVRYANPLGFMTANANTHCQSILFDMGILV